jgi:glycogen phosphorylase
MSTKGVKASSFTGNAPDKSEAPNIARLLQQYGCGPIPFVGSENAFYERHLVFDRVIDP